LRRIAVTIPGRRRISVALDGEKLKMRLPLRIEIAEHDLQVILPPDNPAALKA
jgi:diacylglycerol kinase family enzyme